MPANHRPEVSGWSLPTEQKHARTMILCEVPRLSPLPRRRFLTILLVVMITPATVNPTSLNFLDSGCVRKWRCNNQEDTLCHATAFVVNQDQGCFSSSGSLKQDGSALIDFTASRHYVKYELLYDQCVPSLNLTWNIHSNGQNQTLMLQIVSHEDVFKDDVECVQFDITTASADVMKLRFECFTFLMGTMKLEMTSLVERIPGEPDGAETGALVIHTGPLDIVNWDYDTGECEVHDVPGPHAAIRGTVSPPDVTQSLDSTVYSDVTVETSKNSESSTNALLNGGNGSWSQDAIGASVGGFLAISIVVVILLWHRYNN